MAVDMQSLLNASQGDPTAKVTVQKKWLAEVHRMLAEADALKRAAATAERELARMRADKKLDDGLSSIGEKLMGMAMGRPFA